MICCYTILFNQIQKSNPICYFIYETVEEAKKKIENDCEIYCKNIFPNDINFVTNQLSENLKKVDTITSGSIMKYIENGKVGIYERVPNRFYGYSDILHTTASIIPIQLSIKEIQYPESLIEELSIKKNTTSSVYSEKSKMQMETCFKLSEEVIKHPLFLKMKNIINNN